MKKRISLLLLMLVLIANLAAADPQDGEVLYTVMVCQSAYGMVFMQHMQGMTPEGVDVDMNMETGFVKLIFKDFDVQEYAAGLSPYLAQAGSDVDYNFSSMSGTFTINPDGTIIMDVSLKGGNIKTLFVEIDEDEYKMIKANGKSYDYLTSQLSR